MDHLEIEARIRTWADGRVLPTKLVDRWLALDEPSRNQMLGLAESLKLRAGQFITTFELLEEIAVREAESFDTILHRPTLLRALKGAGSGPGRARVLIDEIRALRYPRLKQATERLSAELAALGLPRGIRVILPRELASDEVRIEIVAHGGSELGELLDALKAKANPLVRIATTLAVGVEV